jgi:hypothetical protein
MLDELLFPEDYSPRSRWHRSGLSARNRRRFRSVLAVLVGLFVLGWSGAIYTAAATGETTRSAQRITQNPLARTAAPEAAFLLEAAVRSFADYRGISGEVQVIIQDPEGEPILPGDVEEGVEVEFAPVDEAAGPDAPPEPGVDGRAPRRPGIWNLILRMRDATMEVPGLRVLTMVPLTEARDGRIGDYHIGEWPTGPGGGPPEGHGAEYAPPRGLIRVTEDMLDMPVSRHFTIADFMTKGQEDVWPKYVVISPRLLDKLELTLQEVEAMGYPVENVGVISGFRHPYYNWHGGDTQGRGALSRHMYGDAADFFIDNDHTFCMDDLTGDGRVTRADLEIIAEAAARVEERHPHLIGGIGIYTPTGAHCGMVHVDTRGTRARW